MGKVIRLGRRLELRRSRRWRWLPEFGISRMSDFFCGGFHLYWLCLAIDYDHLSRRWLSHRETFIAS
jgi:hypothetical protein